MKSEHDAPAKNARLENGQVEHASQQVTAQRILEVKRQVNDIAAAPRRNLAEAGLVRPEQIQGLLSEVDSLLADLLRELDKGALLTTVGQPGQEADQAVQSSREPVPKSQVIPTQVAHTKATEQRDERDGQSSGNSMKSLQRLAAIWPKLDEYDQDSIRDFFHRWTYSWETYHEGFTKEQRAQLLSNMDKELNRRMDAAETMYRDDESSTSAPPVPTLPASAMQEMMR